MFSLRQDDGKHEQTYYVLKEKTRWDLLLLAWFVGIGFTAFAFGSSYNASFNRGIFFMLFLHFATETIAGAYLIYKTKTARILSWIFAIFFVSQAFLLALNPWIEKSTVASVISLEFIWSDSFNFICCFMTLLNPYYYWGCVELKNITFGMILHYIGVAVQLVLLPIIFFITDNFTQRGMPWVLILYTAAFALYFCNHGLSSKMNYLNAESIVLHNKRENDIDSHAAAKLKDDHMHDVAIDKDTIVINDGTDGMMNKGKASTVTRSVTLLEVTNNKLRYEKFTYFVVIIFPMAALAYGIVLSFFRTTESTTGFTYASWIWEDIALGTAVPVGGFIIFYSIFVWVKGRVNREQYLLSLKKNVGLHQNDVNINISNQDKKNLQSIQMQQLA